MNPHVLIWLLIVECAGTYDYKCEEFEKPHQGEAVELAKARFEEFIGWDGLLGDDVPEVKWCTGRCPQQRAEDERNAIWLGSVCAAGVTSFDGKIKVADWGKIGGSALSHELGHWARLKLGIDGDARHIDVEWWELCEVVDAEYQIMGW